MRILLLSCNTGEGHNSTARAIMETLEKRGVVCELRDVLACLSPKLSQFICSVHHRLYKYAPKLSDVGYRAFEYFADPEDTAPVYELLRLGAGKVWQMLMTGRYDAVICVHVFSGMLMTEVRRAWGVEIPCYFVATDYTCSPTVEQCDLDGYFIPHPELAGEFIRAGLPSLRLIPSGIPVSQRFYQCQAQTEARQALGLSQSGLMMLVMGGSVGCGPMRRIALDLLEGLEADTAVAVICGNNEKLFDDLSQIDDPRLKVVGYSKEVPLYMDAADMIVTKPGGLSATEAATKHLPMVLINAVGGCEGRNFDFFLDRGYAVGSGDAETVVKLALELAGSEKLRQTMGQTLSESFRINSAEKIADWVIEAAEAYRRRTGMSTGQPGDTLLKKGGDRMEQTNKQETLLNLARAFAGESQARTRYTVYAGVARQEGYEWIARVFEETADNEAVHAEEFLEQLQKLGGCAPNIDLAAGYPFQLGTTADNLRFAAQGELEEHHEAYPGFAEMARREGYDEAARLWMQIARIEGVHHNTFRSLHEQLVSGTLTEKASPVVWRCLNCGYTYEGTRACDPCPVCHKSAGWQEGQLNKKEMMPKN